MAEIIYNVYLLTENVPWVGVTRDFGNRMRNHKWLGRIRNLKSYKVLYTTTSQRKALEVESLYHDKGYLGKNYGGNVAGKMAVESGHLQRIQTARRIPIVQYNKEGNFIKEWISAAQASKELNISRTNITKACKGKYKTCGGFVWKYKEIVAA